jgi:hypothetical protein
MNAAALKKSGHEGAEFRHELPNAIIPSVEQPVEDEIRPETKAHLIRAAEGMRKEAEEKEEQAREKDREAEELRKEARGIRQDADDLLCKGKVKEASEVSAQSSYPKLRNWEKDGPGVALWQYMNDNYRIGVWVPKAKVREHLKKGKCVLALKQRPCDPTMAVAEMRNIMKTAGLRKDRYETNTETGMIRRIA